MSEHTTPTKHDTRQIVLNTLLILACLICLTVIVAEIYFGVHVIKISTPNEATGPDWRPEQTAFSEETKRQILSQKGITTMAKYNTNKVTNADLPELVGQILDTFEDFLEAKGINIENPEKAEAVADGEDPESICILYGTDYGDLQSDIEDILVNWKLAEPWS